MLLAGCGLHCGEHVAVGGGANACSIEASSIIEAPSNIQQHRDILQTSYKIETHPPTKKDNDEETTMIARTDGFYKNADYVERWMQSTRRHRKIPQPNKNTLARVCIYGFLASVLFFLMGFTSSQLCGFLSFFPFFFCST